METFITLRLWGNSLEPSNLMELSYLNMFIGFVPGVIVGIGLGIWFASDMLTR